MNPSKLINCFDQDPGYDAVPYVDIYDDELSEEQKFKKYVVKVFPKRISKELLEYYPKFKIDHKTKLKKLVGSSALFYGTPGTGKTFMACMLVLLARRNSWLYLDLSTKFYRVTDLLDEFRKLIMQRKDIDKSTGLSAYDSLFEELKRCRYLILDDLGTEKNTDYSFEILDRIIDTRYSENRVTIITTNFDIKILLEKEGYSRIMSRLLDMVQGQPVHLTKVYRKQNIKPIKF